MLQAVALGVSKSILPLMAGDLCVLTYGAACWVGTLVAHDSRAVHLMQILGAAESCPFSKESFVPDRKKQHSEISQSSAEQSCFSLFSFLEQDCLALMLVRCRRQEV